MRHRTGARALFRFPLMRAGRALRQFPLVAEQVLEVVVAPVRRSGGPSDLQAAGDRVTAFARAEPALPAEALLLDGRGFGLRPHLRFGAGAVSLAEGVTAGDERNRLFVVHRHTAERFANIPGRRDGIRVAVRALRIDVDQTHLNGAERSFEVPVAGVAFVIQPPVLGAPVDVSFRLPDVLATAAETEGLESHRLQGDVASENDEVGPGNLPAILLLDRPKQSARLVEADVVGPAVEGREALLARSGAAATVADAIRAGAVPCHANTLH